MLSGKNTPIQSTPLKLPDCLTEQGEVGGDTCLEDAGGCCALYH